MKVTKVTKRDRRYPSSRGDSFRHYNSNPRLYVGLEGENVLENMANRKSRPSKLYERFMGEVLQRLDLPTDTEYRWSQKAGCPCGCSPGFVFKNLPGHWDAWVTFSGPDARVNPAKADLAADRAAQIGLTK